MPNALAVDLAASAARTTSGSGSAVDVGLVRPVGEFILYITAASGTDPVLELNVETSEDSAGGWRVVATEQVNGTGNTRREFIAAELARYVRVSWVLSGTTPSYTFSVSGDAHGVYARKKDIKLPGELLDQAGDASVWREILVASTEADGFLAERYHLPLVSWDSILSRNVGFIAAYRLMCTDIGFQPDSNGVDAQFEKNYDQAMKWLKMVSCFHITPSGIVDSSPTVATKRWAIASGGRREI